VRAIGIVRVSQAKGREGESFASPTEQRDRIVGACERDGLELVATREEIDISGGTPLLKREGLLSAVEAIEAGEAEVLMVAYFDRLVRSLRVQDEVVSRVEAAGGRVVALDFGEVSGATAASWLSGTMIGAVAEYHRRSAKERSGAAQAMAVARGVAPWPNVPAGYERGSDGVLVPAADAPAVREAFEMRAEGASIAEIRAFLAGQGIHRSYHGVQGMFSQRTYLGEIHFGKLSNLHAHPAIVDRGLWQEVQRAKVSRGRKAKSERLLARLGVLRCGSCGARMVVASAHFGQYPTYRCPPNGDCPRHVAISALKVEGAVITAVKAALADVEGRASVAAHARDAERAASSAQDKLESAIRSLADFTDEPAAQETLSRLRDERDRTLEVVDQLGGKAASLSLTGDDWDRLLLAGKRDIAPGRGSGRITIKLFV